MLIESGDLIPVLRDAVEIPWTKRKTQILAFLYRGPVTFKTYVYDTNVGDIAPLSTYFNPEKWTEQDLNLKFGNRATVEEITVAAANSQGPNTTIASGGKAKSASLKPRLMVIPGGKSAISSLTSGTSSPKNRGSKAVGDTTEDKSWSSVQSSSKRWAPFGSGEGASAFKPFKAIRGSERLNEKVFICDPKPAVPTSAAAPGALTNKAPPPPPSNVELAKALFKIELLKRISDEVPRPLSPISRPISRAASTGLSTCSSSGPPSRSSSVSGSGISRPASSISTDTELLRADPDDFLRLPSLSPTAELEMSAKFDPIFKCPEGLKYLLERRLSSDISESSQPPSEFMTQFTDQKSEPEVLIPEPITGVKAIDQVVRDLTDTRPHPLSPWTMVNSFSNFIKSVDPHITQKNGTPLDDVESIPLYEFTPLNDLDKVPKCSFFGQDEEKEKQDCDLWLRRVPLFAPESTDNVPLLDLPPSKFINIFREAKT